jgi:hypothetical protein
MKMGGKDLSEEEAIRMFKRSGLLPYMDTMPGTGYKGGDVLPIHAIEGGLGTRLVETVQLMEFNLSMISQITGISPVALGQTPDKDQPVTTTQLQLNGTNNSMRPLINSIFTLKDWFASASAIRIQTICKFHKDTFNNYARVVGRLDMQKLKDGIGFGVDYGIRMETRPSGEEKQRILNAAQLALQRGRDGEAQIDLDVYLYIEEQLMGDANLKEMRQKLRFVIRKEKEMMQSLKERNRQIEFEGLSKIEDQKAQKEIQLKQMESQMKQNEITTQGTMDLSNKYIDANIEYLNMIEESLKENVTK